MSRQHRVLDRRRWQRIRAYVLRRDGYRCVLCKRAGRLEVDHVTPIQREPGQDVYDVNGLQTLCRGCHIEKTKKENRRPRTDAELEWQALVNSMT